jgi:molybdate transport system ATP-binding protein
VSDILLDLNLTHSLHTVNGLMTMTVNLTVLKGEVLIVTGDSGAGKTTLLRQIAGFVKPAAGKILYQDRVWLDTTQGINVPPQKRNIGFVFQDYALFPHLSVRDNLRFALDKGQDERKVDELLEAVDLVNLADRKPFQLSGGQQQRVTLARALVRMPDLLLLDEPLSALDTNMRKRLQEYLHTLRQHQDFTVIMVTHDLDEIFSLGSRVAVMDHGIIKKLGTPVEIYSSHAAEVDGLVMYGKILSVDVGDSQLRARVIIQKKIHEIDLPLSKLNEMVPGRSFIVNYTLKEGNIQLLD